MQAPGADILKDPYSWDWLLKPYIMVIGHLANDHRVLMWDLMNEPDNGILSNKGELPNKSEMVLKLLKREWQWARAAKPSQPLTSGVWHDDWSDG